MPMAPIIQVNKTTVKVKTKEEIKKEQDEDLNKTPEAAFANLVARYNKDVKNTTEFNRRKANFETNFKLVKEFNNQTAEKFKLGINELSDWSPEEIAQILTFKPVEDKPDAGNVTFPNQTKRFLQTFNTSIDWRDQGAVSGVKNQYTCGSCYTFAAAAAIEGAYKLKTGTLVEFSTQQLLDCSSNSIFKNLGCKGGNMENTFRYLI